MLLCSGWSVIVDGIFLVRADRECFRSLAERTGAAFSVLAPQATSEQLRERVLVRQLQAQDASVATLDVLAQPAKVIEPLTPEEGSQWDILSPNALLKNTALPVEKLSQIGYS